MMSAISGARSANARVPPSAATSGLPARYLRKVRRLWVENAGLLMLLWLRGKLLFEGLILAIDIPEKVHLAVAHDHSGRVH